jgi:hypothetical protein
MPWSRGAVPGESKASPDGGLKFGRKLSAVSEGFVYILMNSSMPGLVKIGLTEDTSEARAASLSSASGVPTRFTVVYDELVSDCRQVEARMHERFREYRVSERREFFRVPKKTAIKALQEEALTFAIATGAGQRVEILPKLLERFPTWIRPGTTSIALVQLGDVCLLEVTREPYAALRDRIVEQVDLAIITDDEDEEADYFKVFDPVEVNARKFLDLDVLSLFMTTPLFSEEAAREAGIY